ncbi:hypothetical protein P262_00238 [Cronobacter malonaticus]|uniref:Uncharacterized protein n=1 Tax=Cronobacter malonaticus TaxID=413503 RepID=V5TUA5_9ENTR|nr:hypothetical protein P262_00238 [Cronobacter malonaticus]
MRKQRPAGRSRVAASYPLAPTKFRKALLIEQGFLLSGV